MKEEKFVMSCGPDKKDFLKHENCVCQVLRAIKDIQDAATDDCECPTNCFLEPLGAVSPTGRGPAPNTRVFILKTKDGSPFHAFFDVPGTNRCVSVFFRVEEIFDNCCATLRVLVPLRREGQGQPQVVDLTQGNDRCCISLDRVCQVNDFAASNSCITVDLSCFCAVQCIEDIFLANVCD